MEIRNIFFTALILVAVGCQTRPTRPVPQRPLEEKPKSTAPTGTPEPVVVKKNLLPVGLYFGPGAMRAFAHVGVLKGLSKGGVQVAAVGGVEWGALVAGLYSLNKKPNEVEWNMMKLREENFSRKGLLGSQAGYGTRNQFGPFLKLAFGESRLENGQVPFMCPVTDGETNRFIAQGVASEEIFPCIAFPPLLEIESESVVSGIVGTGDWAGELRKRGAKYVIYVDVVSKGNFLNSRKYQRGNELMALWTAAKTISKSQQKFADLAIEVPLSMDLGDFDQRRKAISEGERAVGRFIDHIMKFIEVEER